MTRRTTVPQCDKCGRMVGAIHQCKKTVADDLIAAFTERYIPVTESGCWIWIGRDQSEGYGFMPLGGRHNFDLAHRVSWQLYRGPIDRKICVLHRCDVRCCVNPDHLFIGTKGDNNRDAAMKGRSRNNGSVGSDNGNAKLSTDDVLEIRRLYGPYRPYHYGLVTGVELAKRYSVTPHAIYEVIKRKKWAHV
jgi:hypothetical protein